jgi:replicative DNA helicase
MAEKLDRIPPHSVEAEMAVLGAMLIEKEAITKAIDVVIEHDFYQPAHRAIFLVVRDLYLENQPVDAITVGEELRKRHQLDQIGGAGIIASLINSVSTAANVEYYATIVRDKSVLRQLVNAGSTIVDAAFNEKNSAEQILDSSESVLFKIAQRRASRGFTPVAELVHPTLEMLEKLTADKRDVPGLRTGFRDFDQMTAGLQPSELIIIAARPSMGKTSFALNIAEHVAIVDKKPVALFSLEMSKESLMLRLLCSHARVDSQSTRKGFISTQNWSRLTTVAASPPPWYSFETAMHLRTFPSSEPVATILSSSRASTVKPTPSS